MSAAELTEVEQEAYDVLHYEGLAAFDRKYPGTSSSTFDNWEARGLVKQNWLTYGVKTFKKYATPR